MAETSSDRRQRLLGDVSRRIIAGTLTPQDVTAMGVAFVAPGWTVREFIAAEKDLGEVKLIGGKYVFVGKSV